MKTIDVKYIDTIKYRVRIHQDDWPGAWDDYTDLSGVVQFRDNDFTSYQDLDSSGYLTETGKLTPATLAKLRAGKMFTLDYRRYSNADGGHYYLDGSIPRGQVDSSEVNGFIILNDGAVRGMSYNQRRAWAEQALKTYTLLANGETYRVEIETAAGQYVDSCGGFIGYEAVKDYINETLADSPRENLDVKGVYPGYGYGPSEYEVDF